MKMHNMIPGKNKFHINEAYELLLQRKFSFKYLFDGRVQIQIIKISNILDDDSDKLL